jgi:hypothetical protein
VVASAICIGATGNPAVAIRWAKLITVGNGGSRGGGIEKPAARPQDRAREARWERLEIKLAGLLRSPC